MQQMAEWGVMQERTGEQSMKNRLPSLPRLTQTAILASHCLRKDPLVHAASVRRQTYAGLAPNLHKLTAQQALSWLRRSRQRRICQGFAGHSCLLRRSDRTRQLASWGGQPKSFFCQESGKASEASCLACAAAACPSGREDSGDGGDRAAGRPVTGQARYLSRSVHQARAVAGAGCAVGVGRLSPSSSALTTRSPRPSPTLMPMPVCISTTEVWSSMARAENGPGPLLP